MGGPLEAPEVAKRFVVGWAYGGGADGRGAFARGLSQVDCCVAWLKKYLSVGLVQSTSR